VRTLVIRSALLWPVKVGAMAVALWYFLREPLPSPADWILAGVSAILLHLAYAAATTGRRRGGDLRRLQHAGEPPVDGARIALIGTLKTAAPLEAPISGTPCVGYTYEMFHVVQHRSQDGSSGTSRRVPDFSGIALAATVIHTMQGDVPLLSYPFLSGFAEDTYDDPAHLRRAAGYVTQTVFEKTMPFVGELSTLDHAMRETGGAMKKDWRMSDATGVAGLTLREQRIPVDAAVCAFGIWSDARKALVPGGSDARALLLVAGDVEQASRQLASGERSSRSIAIGSFVVAAALVSTVLFAPWNVLRRVPGSSLVIDKQTERLKDALWANDLHGISASIRYLDPNLAFEEASRTPLMLARSPEAAQLLIDRGGRVTAHDANGYSVLMNAAERGSPELLRFLVAHGADANEHLTSDPARTPLRLAKDNNTPEAVDALLKAGARE
jgi:hypothetical protein